MRHVFGRPPQLPPAREHGLLDVLVAASVADVPLAGGHDLERLVALLVEVGHAGGGLRIPVEIAAVAEHRDGRLAGRERRLARDGLEGVAVDDPLRGLALDPAVTADHSAGGQVQLAPPGDVGEVAEGAAHGDAGALVRLRRLVGQDRDLHPEEGRCDRGAEQRLVALVVRVCDERADGGQQLGTCGLDVDRIAPRAVERDAVVGARVLACLQLGLRHRRVEGDVPQRGRVAQVGLAPRVVAQERLLRHGLGVRRDGGVERGPVHRQAELTPQVLERLLVDGGQLVAELDEVGAADRDLTLRVRLRRGLEVRVVRDRRITAHAVEVLHPPLGGQAVVVPSHGVEHVLAAHPLVAGHRVGVGVAEHVAHVQRPRDRGRGSVDAEHLVAARRPGERIGPLLCPYLAPLGLEAFEDGLVGQGARQRERIGHGTRS